MMIFRVIFDLLFGLFVSGLIVALLSPRGNTGRMFYRMDTRDIIIFFGALVGYILAAWVHHILFQPYDHGPASARVLGVITFAFALFTGWLAGKLAKK